MKKYQPITLSLIKEIDKNDDPKKKFYMRKVDEEYVDNFRDVFGNVILLDDEHAIKSAHLFDWSDTAERLLDKEDYKEFEKILKPWGVEREKIRSKTWAEYDKEEKKLTEAYEKAKKKIEDKAWSACKPIDKEIEKIEALAFVRLYRKGMGK